MYSSFWNAYDLHLYYLIGVADGMKQLQMFMMLAEVVSEKKDGTGKGKQAGATAGSVPPQSGQPSTKPGGSDKPTDNASPCLLAIAGSATGWMWVGTNHGCA